MFTCACSSPGWRVSGLARPFRGHGSVHKHTEISSIVYMTSGLSRKTGIPAARAGIPACRARKFPYKHSSPGWLKEKEAKRVKIVVCLRRKPERSCPWQKKVARGFFTFEEFFFSTKALRYPGPYLHHSKMHNHVNAHRAGGRSSSTHINSMAGLAITHQPGLELHM